MFLLCTFKKLLVTLVALIKTENHRINFVNKYTAAVILFSDKATYSRYAIIYTLAH